MRADDTPADGERVHRPLPSVNMPLLRDHRRATRTKQVAIAVVGGLSLIAGAAGLLFNGGSDDADGEPPPLAMSATGPADAEVEDAGRDADADVTPAPAPRVANVSPDTREPVTLGAVSRVSANFGDARGFRPAMTRAGLSDEEYSELETALEGTLDFRRCRAADRIVLERDVDDILVRFEYHTTRTEFVEVTRDGVGAMAAQRVERPVEETRIVRGGTVRSSLGEAFERASLGRALVGRFIEAFDGRIDFQRHTRAGDAFRVVVVEERLDGEFLRYGDALALQYSGQRAGTLRAYWHENRRGRGEYYDETGRAVRGGWLRTPLRYERISSRYDPRRMHPILRRIHPHNGVDYAAGTGTRVWAAADGTVTFAGVRGANGNLVAIRHADGYETFYAHLHRITRGIRRGVEVEQGQSIGQVGSTGRSTGPHLHFGLKRRGRFLDPLSVINGPGRPLPPGQLGRFRRQMRELDGELEAVPMATPAPATEPPEPAEAEPAEVPMD